MTELQKIIDRLRGAVRVGIGSNLYVKFMAQVADDLEALPQYDKEIERLNARIKDYQDACSQKQEIINDSLRLLLFYAHSNMHHVVYGDDGELQCNTCGCDFKRDSSQVLLDKISNYNLAQWAKMQEARKHD